jgi:hypothetical protein
MHAHHNSHLVSRSLALLLRTLQLDGKMKMGTRMLSPTSIADLMDGSGGIGSNGSVNIFSTKHNSNNNNGNKGANKRSAGSDEDMDEGMLSVEAGVEALRASKAIKVRSSCLSFSDNHYYLIHVQALSCHHIARPQPLLLI